MTLKKESNDQTKISSDKTDNPAEAHEALRLEKYRDLLKSDTPIDDIIKTIKPNDEAFKEFNELIKTAKYRKHIT